MIRHFLQLGLIYFLIGCLAIEPAVFAAQGGRIVTAKEVLEAMGLNGKPVKMKDVYLKNWRHIPYSVRTQIEEALRQDPDLMMPKYEVTRLKGEDFRLTLSQDGKTTAMDFHLAQGYIQIGSEKITSDDINDVISMVNKAEKAIGVDPNKIPWSFQADQFKVSPLSYADYQKLSLQDRKDYIAKAHRAMTAMGNLALKDVPTAQSEAPSLFSLLIENAQADVVKGGKCVIAGHVGEFTERGSGLVCLNRELRCSDTDWSILCNRDLYGTDAAGKSHCAKVESAGEDCAKMATNSPPKTADEFEKFKARLTAVIDLGGKACADPAGKPVTFEKSSKGQTAISELASANSKKLKAEENLPTTPTDANKKAVVGATTAYQKEKIKHDNEASAHLQCFSVLQRISEFNEAANKNCEVAAGGSAETAKAGAVPSSVAGPGNSNSAAAGTASATAVAAAIPTGDSRPAGGTAVVVKGVDGTTAAQQPGASPAAGSGAGIAGSPAGAPAQAGPEAKIPGGTKVVLTGPTGCEGCTEPKLGGTGAPTATATPGPAAKAVAAGGVRNADELAKAEKDSMKSGSDSRDSKRSPRAPKAKTAWYKKPWVLGLGIILLGVAAAVGGYMLVSRAAKKSAAAISAPDSRGAN